MSTEGWKLTDGATRYEANRRMGKSRKHSEDPFTQRCLDLFEGVLLTPRQETLFCEGAWLLFGQFKRARKPQPPAPWEFWR